MENFANPNASSYVIPTGISKDVCNVIINELNQHSNLFSDAKVLRENGFDVDSSIRKSKVLWVPTDHWISSMMTHFIHSSNNSYFQYDLTCWAEQIQFTVYDEVGSFYTWHEDINSSQFAENEVRKLSISLLLSEPSEYEGGELQLLVNGKMESFKPNMGDAIIFPSLVKHRVKPIKSGVRRSLVGWFGGPAWR